MHSSTDAFTVKFCVFFQPRATGETLLNKLLSLCLLLYFCLQYCWVSTIQHRPFSQSLLLWPNQLLRHTTVIYDQARAAESHWPLTKLKYIDKLWN